MLPDRDWQIAALGQEAFLTLYLITVRAGTPGNSGFERIKNIQYQTKNAEKYYKLPQKIWFKHLGTECCRFISCFALRAEHKRYIIVIPLSSSAPFKKMKTFHLYNAAGAHYNTIEPCQSNFVRVKPPRGKYALWVVQIFETRSITK